MAFLIFFALVMVLVGIVIHISTYFQGNIISFSVWPKYFIPIYVFAIFFYGMHRKILIDWFEIADFEHTALFGLFYFVLDFLLIIGFVLEILWGKPHPKAPEVWKMLWIFLCVFCVLFTVLGIIAVYGVTDEFVAEWNPAFEVARISFPYIFLSLTLIASYVQRKRMKAIR